MSLQLFGLASFGFHGSDALSALGDLRMRYTH